MTTNLVNFGADLFQIFFQLNENGTFVSKFLIGIGSTLAAKGILAWRKYCNSVDNYHKSRYQRPVDHVTHYGSCFCERVSFKVLASKNLKAVDTPSKIRFPRVSIPYNDFELLSDEQILSICSKSKASSLNGIYVFCSFCGVHILHSHSDNPVYIQVNAECLDHSSVSSIDVSYHSTGEEGSLQARSPLRNFEIQDRRGSGFLSLKDRSDTDIVGEENPYIQCMDNESDSSSSSTTMTYDFTPSQKLMHHLHLGSELESVSSNVNRRSIRSGESYFFPGEVRSSIGELSNMQFPIRQKSVSQDHSQVPPTRQYNDLYRKQTTPDWTQGVNYVYNSIHNDGVLREVDQRKERSLQPLISSSQNSYSSLSKKPSSSAFSNECSPIAPQSLSHEYGGFENIHDDRRVLISPSYPHQLSTSQRSDNRLDGFEYGADSNTFNRLRKHLAHLK